MKIKDVKIKDEFDYLTLLDFVYSYNSHKRGIFQCVCGKIVEKVIQDVYRKGAQPKSCGCKTVFKKQKKEPKSQRFNNDLACQYLSMKW